MRLLSRLGPFRPALRLRTLMVLVIVVSVGLALEVNRRRREALRLLAIISESRERLVVVHEANTRNLREEARKLREKLGLDERGEFVFGPGRRVLHHRERRLLYVEERARWEAEMIPISRWAADHPSQPWPPMPPEPIDRTDQIFRTPPPRPVSPPAPKPSPGGPIDVPTVVKKKE